MQELAVKFGEDKAGVVPPKPKAVLHNLANPHRAGFIGDIIQITSIIRMVQIHRGRHRLLLNCLNTEDRLNAPGGSQQMAKLAFRAGNCQTISVASKNEPNSI